MYDKGCHREEGLCPDVAISRYDVCNIVQKLRLYQEIATALRASQ